MKCYWTVNSSYWRPLRVSQYEVNTSWPPQQKSIVLQYWKPKINWFSYAEKKNMAYVHQLLDQPSQWQTSQQAGPCSVPKFTNTSITVKHLLIKNKNINQSKSSLLIWQYVSYLFLFILVAVTAAGFVQCGGRKTSPRTSTIVQFVLYIWSFEISVNILRNQKQMIGLDSYSRQVYNLIYISLWIDCLFEIRKLQYDRCRVITESLMRIY